MVLDLEKKKLRVEDVRIDLAVDDDDEREGEEMWSVRLSST